jgi:predicted deacylase
MILRLIGLLILISFVVVSPVEAEREAFSVGNITAQPGEAVSGIIPIPAAEDPGTELPVTIVHGAEPGPVLALVAGNHGYEYPPILALLRVRKSLDPKELSGTVILVHVANVPSFLGRTIYYSPIDGKNLNRVYPGKKDGTTSERIAYVITTEVIEQSDYLLDLHCGDGNEDLRPYIYMPVTGDEKMDAAIRDIAMVFGFDHIVVDRSRPADPSASIYCSTTGITRGKPAITVESGYLGTTDDASTMRIVDGVFSLMRHFQMLPGKSTRVEHPVFLEPTEVLLSPATGLLFPHVQRGRSVAKGTLLATVTDFFGEKVAEVRAPFAGIVLYIVATPPITKDEPVGMIGAMKPQT